MTIYWDLMVLLNILVDLLLLLGANRLAGFPPEWKRVIPAAMLGGLYGGLYLLPGFSFLGCMAWRIAFLGLMGVFAFGWSVSAWKRCGIFALLSFALGGMVIRLGEGNIPGLLMAAVLIWILCHVGFDGRIGGRKFVPLEISFGNSWLRLIALCDSGNLLRDPVTGEQVLVVDSDAGETLTGLTAEQLAKPLENLCSVPGLRLIPYRSVGTTGGFLLARRFDSVRIGDWRGSAVVAFAPQAIGRGEGYRALTGGAMV